MHVRAHVFMAFMMMAAAHGLSGGVQLALRALILLWMVMRALGKKHHAQYTECPGYEELFHADTPVSKTKLTNPKLTQKLLSEQGRKQLSRGRRVTITRGGDSMTRFIYRILLSALAGLLLTPYSVFAQEAQGQDKSSSGQTQSDNQEQGKRQWRRGGRQRQHMAKLAEKLNLTDAQKQQFQEISQNMRKQAMTIRQDSSLSDDQKKEKMQSLRKQAHQQMFGVLTPEQKDKLKEMREQHMKEQKDKGPGNQASARQADDDDPFAGMTSDDDDGPGSNGGSF
jgi:Spy/CpxP family protein refolding chaperone